jgi:cation:H+ antiporter
MDAVLLLLSFAIILGGAELFTNGIEWFGHKVGLAEGAVGSVLAAIGTALPETMIPIIAILFSPAASTSQIGIGAILGAPFMLATLAMFVTGAAVLLTLGRRPAGDTMLVDPRRVANDLRTFGLTYAVATAAALVLPLEPTWPKALVAAFLVGSYGWYVRGHLAAEADVDPEGLSPLRLHRLDRRQHRADPDGHPRLRVISVQVVLAVVLIVLGAIVFVDAVARVSRTIGISEVLVALVVAPIATELAEGFNAVIWVRQTKDILALGNVTGAMVFQAAIPTSVALLFAPREWVVQPGSYVAFMSAVIAFASTAVIFAPMLRTRRLRGRWLLAGGAFYLGYLAIVAIGIATG